MLSPAYKWLELRFLPRLRDYMSRELDRNQTGFVPGLGTSVNLVLLLERLRECRRREGRCCVFVDFKSAYNTVRRERLYRALIARGIFAVEEVNFLRSLHDALYFRDGRGERVYLRDGVH